MHNSCGPRLSSGTERTSGAQNGRRAGPTPAGPTPITPPDQRRPLAALSCEWDRLVEGKCGTGSASGGNWPRGQDGVRAGGGFLGKGRADGGGPGRVRTAINLTRSHATGAAPQPSPQPRKRSKTAIREASREGAREVVSRELQGEEWADGGDQGHVRTVKNGRCAHAQAYTDTK